MLKPVYLYVLYYIIYIHTTYIYVCVIPVDGHPELLIWDDDPHELMISIEAMLRHLDGCSRGPSSFLSTCSAPWMSSQGSEVPSCTSNIFLMCWSENGKAGIPEHFFDRNLQVSREGYSGGAELSVLQRRSGDDFCWK